MELKKVVGDGQLFWRELARRVRLASFTYLPERRSQDENPTSSLFSITIGPRSPIRSRPPGNNRMKAEKQENCPGISPKSYVGILLIWTM